MTASAHLRSTYLAWTNVKCSLSTLILRSKASLFQGEGQDCSKWGNDPLTLDVRVVYGGLQNVNLNFCRQCNCGWSDWTDILEVHWGKERPTCICTLIAVHKTSKLQKNSIQHNLSNTVIFKSCLRKDFVTHNTLCIALTNWAIKAV